MTRAEARAARVALPKFLRAERSEDIMGHLLAWDVLEGAQTVMAYASVGSEVDTWPLLSALLRARKTLLLPRCRSRGMMDAVCVSGLDELVRGPLRIPEPPAHRPAADPAGIDLILVPGLAFDLRGNRLGQGAGYYDRFLAGFGGMTCGVAFAAQVLPALSAKAHDVPVRALATEAGITIFGQEE